MKTPAAWCHENPIDMVPWKSLWHGVMREGSPLWSTSYKIRLPGGHLGSHHCGPLQASQLLESGK
jgi:hypothetical protein